MHFIADDLFQRMSVRTFDSLPVNYMLKTGIELSKHKFSFRHVLTMIHLQYDQEN